MHAWMDKSADCMKEGRENLWMEEGKERERGIENRDRHREAGFYEGRNGRRKEGRKEGTLEAARNLWKMSRAEVLCTPRKKEGRQEWERERERKEASNVLGGCMDGHMQAWEGGCACAWMDKGADCMKE